MQSYKNICKILWASVFFTLMLPFLLLANVENDITLDLPTPQNISVESPQNTISLVPYMRFASNLNVNTAQSAFKQQNKFLPFNQFSLTEPPETYWFLIKFLPIRDKNMPAAYLNLGNTLNKSSHLFVLPNKGRKWQMLQDVYTKGQLQPDDEDFTQNKPSTFAFSNSGLYDLTALRDGGELLIFSPGIPSLWFSPVLEAPAKAVSSLDRRLAPILIISLVLLMFFSFWRGLREEGDARFWASLLTLCALVEYVFGVPQNTANGIAIWDMAGIIAAFLAIFLIPHVGRHYMVTEKNDPHLDDFLQFLALPAILPMTIILIPLPEFLYITRFAPLWGLYAFIPLLFTLPALFAKRKGALFYAYFCLCIGTSSLLAFLFHTDTAWQLSTLVGLFFAMVGMFLAPRQNEKNVHDLGSTQEIDMIGEFALNNVLMRDALFRIEAKLRDPFDRVMREACFIDFNLTIDDYADSIESLVQKEFGQKIDNATLFAARDIKARTERMQLHTQSLILACRDLSSMMGQMPGLAKRIPDYKPIHDLFNLKTLVLQACDIIRQDAQDKQVGLGWYIAPHISLFYRGERDELANILGLLLRDAISSTAKGMVSIRVRRANSPNPGHIIFTISDSGKSKNLTTRSSLSLIKAWELSTKYNGQVELSSSSNGLSISFSLECIAMDAKGEKPLVFASLDDITLAVNESKNSLNANEDVPALTSAIGESGGNVLFSNDDSNIHDPKAKRVNNAPINTRQTNTPQNPADSTQTEYGEFVERAVRPTILIICPLSIQRQTLAWYLNTYEVWESLDAESALAFYAKRPASIVIVHSALGMNACNNVLADLRFMEDNLGSPPASIIGLYQTQNDVEFLQHAGCNYTFPAHIGRDDLCHAVATIMTADPLLPPIADVYIDRSLINTAPPQNSLYNQLKYEQRYAADQPQVTRHLHVGSVIDGSLHVLERKTPFDPLVEVSENMIHERRTSQESTDNANTSSHKKNNSSPATHLPRTVTKRTHAGSISDDQEENKKTPFTDDHFIEKNSIISRFLRALRPKPNVSLQDNMSSFDNNWVSDPTPIETPDSTHNNTLPIENNGENHIHNTDKNTHENKIKNTEDNLPKNKANYDTSDNVNDTNSDSNINSSYPRPDEVHETHEDSYIRETDNTDYTSGTHDTNYIDATADISEIGETHETYDAQNKTFAEETYATDQLSEPPYELSYDSSADPLDAPLPELPYDPLDDPENDFIKRTLPKTKDSEKQKALHEQEEVQIDTIDYVLAQQLEEENRKNASKAAIRIEPEEELPPISSALTFLPSSQNSITEDEDLPTIGIIYSDQAPQEETTITAEIDLHPEGILMRTGIVSEREITPTENDEQENSPQENSHEHNKNDREVKEVVQLSHAMLMKAQKDAQKSTKKEKLPRKITKNIPDLNLQQKEPQTKTKDKSSENLDDSQKTVEIVAEIVPQKIEEKIEEKIEDTKKSKTMQLSFFPHNDDNE